jgi:hypothetical protein
MVSIYYAMEGETNMINMKTGIAIIVAAVVFGIFMSLQSGILLDWQRAVIAGVAFSVLGLLIQYVQARRSDR